MASVASIALPAARLSLVIPAWNEAESIEQAIREACAALSAVTSEFEIIVVDDGSSDRTAELVRSEAAVDARVRLVEHPRNLGYGAALKSGFEAARLELVAFTDADCQFDLRDLEYVLPLARRYDIASGYRIDRKDRTHRRFYSWGYNTLVALLLGTGVRDVDCAFKVFRRDRLMEILPTSKNYFANAEMFTEARRLGLAVVEVGVQHRPRVAGRSKVSVFDVPRTLRTLLPFWWSRVLFPAADPKPAAVGGWFWAGFAALAIVAAALLFPNLSYPLIEPDEARYAEIAREMVTSGDWIAPTLNHEAYLDKPPLLYWLVAGSFRIFGTHDWASRLVPVTAALLTLLATYVFGRRMVGLRAAFCGAATLALSMGFMLAGRFVVLDGLLGLFVTVSLFAAYDSVRGERLVIGWWLISAAACAAGVLVKGPVAIVLAAVPIAAHQWLGRTPSRVRLKHWALFGVMILLVTAPWFVAISVRNPEFAYYFFWKHNVARFVAGAYHSRPAWFYLPVLALGCMPWTLLAVPLVRFLFTRSRDVADARSGAVGFCVLSAGWCVLFFSLSRGKLPLYILPACPSIALVLGAFLDHALLRPSLVSVWQRLQSLVPRYAVAGISAAGVVLSFATWLLRLRSLSGFITLASIWCMFMLAGLLVRRRLSPKFVGAFCCVATFALIWDCGQGVFPNWAAVHSPLAQSAEVRTLLLDEKTGVACCGREWGSIAFYLGRENVENFSDRPMNELTEFMSRQPRTVLIIKATAELDWFRAAVPRGMTLRPLSESPSSICAVVEPTSAGNAAESVTVAPSDSTRR